MPGHLKALLGASQREAANTGYLSHLYMQPYVKASCVPSQTPASDPSQTLQGRACVPGRAHARLGHAVLLQVLRVAKVADLYQRPPALVQQRVLQLYVAVDHALRRAARSAVKTLRRPWRLVAHATRQQRVLQSYVAVGHALRRAARSAVKTLKPLDASWHTRGGWQLMTRATASSCTVAI